MTLSSERGTARRGRGAEPEWWIVAPPATGSFDGIAHFSAELAAAINEIEPARLMSSHAEFAEAAEVRGIFLQYSPPALVTSDLPRLLSKLSRLRARGVPIVTTVHEYWSPATLSPKRAIWRWLCKRALSAVAARSSRLVATTPYAASVLAETGIPGAKDAAIIPIGTGIPAFARAEAADDGASFGGQACSTAVMFGQPAILDRDVVLHFARWVAAQSPRPRWIWIARSAEEMRAWWRGLGAPDVVEIHGGLPAGRVSQLLSEASIGLAVYDDGASTRRSSLAALVAHGLPVVGLDGRFTDDRLRKSGAFLLSPIGNAPAFIANLERVLANEALRGEMAAASRRLHETDLSWVKIATQYLSVAKIR